jgi:hypothetical protein
MVPDRRYVANSEAYLEVAYAALASRFPNRASFDKFYTALPDDSRRNQFLRLASFYRYLVKKGDWHVHAEDSVPVVNYLTNSYKLVALFSLIESLSDEPYVDFYSWLNQRDSATTFPIPDTVTLTQLHEDYKESFGSIRRCVAFFRGLPLPRQNALCSAISIEGKPLSSIEEVAKFLYDLRSKFVHNAYLILEVSNHIVLSQRATVRTNLTLNDLLDLFEEGLLAWFCQETYG